MIMPTASQPSPRTRDGGAHKLWLALECAALFLGVPAAVAAGWIRTWVIPLLVLMALGCGLTLRWGHQIRLRDLFRRQIPAGEWRRILLIYAMAVPGLLALLWWTKPGALFSLMCDHPAIWLLVMVLYPVVSVIPQELIYRVFFFERYLPLFGNRLGLPLASAAVFAFGHLVFHNWPAVVLTGIGGWLFGLTYRRTSSLLLVSVEHALYGGAIFTLGYGEFFFDGTLRLVRGG
jgi:membrane protease YdiL (CAAX protease family)